MRAKDLIGKKVVVKSKNGLNWRQMVNLSESARFKQTVENQQKNGYLTIEKVKEDGTAVILGNYYQREDYVFYDDKYNVDEELWKIISKNVGKEMACKIASEFYNKDMHVDDDGSVYENWSDWTVGRISGEYVYYRTKGEKTQVSITRETKQYKGLAIKAEGDKYNLQVGIAIAYIRAKNEYHRLKLKEGIDDLAIMLNEQ